MSTHNQPPKDKKPKGKSSNLHADPKGKPPNPHADPTDTGTIQPSYSRIMAFPVEVMLPMRLLQLNNGLRQLRITQPDQPLPKPIVDWLKQDPRYTQWIDDAVSPSSDDSKSDET